MKLDIEVEASLFEKDDVEFTGPLGGWPLPLVNVFLVDDNRISDAADLVKQVNEASED
jgi:hypothetical protein